MLTSVKELKVHLNKMVSQEGIDNALRQAGILIESTAKELCPVDTGMLRESIHASEPVDNSIYVGSILDYAPYVEYGTGLFATGGDGRKTPWVYRTPDGQFHYTEGQSPQPFLTPALVNNEKQIKAIFIKAIMREL